MVCVTVTEMHVWKAWVQKPDKGRRFPWSENRQFSAQGKLRFLMKICMIGSLLHGYTAELVTPQKHSRTTELPFDAVSRILARFSWFFVGWACQEQGFQLPCLIHDIQQYFHFSCSARIHMTDHCARLAGRQSICVFFFESKFLIIYI